MQIVGLDKEDGYKYIHDNNFTGINVFKTNNMDVNFATHPIQGFQEININLLENSGLNSLGRLDSIRRPLYFRRNVWRSMRFL